MDATYITNHVRDEVEGAKGYLNLYKETNDIQVLEMCVDELTHANYFIKKAATLSDDLKTAFNDVKAAIYEEIKKERTDR